jgi:acyl-CoA reductase-like NAD-dependent aldehyde dehydrogenase
MIDMVNQLSKPTRDEMAPTVVPQPPTAAPAVEPGQLYINGVWREASDGVTAPTITPIDESEITTVAQATESDVEAAVTAARTAFDEGPWPGLNIHARAKVLRRIAELIEQNLDELAYLEAIDMGKPIAMARAIDVPMTVQLFHYYAGIATQLEGSTRGGPSPTTLPTAVAGLNYTEREPLGVVAAITPFNFPLLLSATKIAPALAAGNCVIHKPASIAPLSAIRIAQIIEEAGLPTGVFNLLTGPGGRLGNQLVEHPAVNKIAFTGSTAVGKGIIRRSAETLKKTTMELGGKSANIVFADADLDSALEHAWFSIFFNSGEICVAGSRMLLERSIHDEFVERLVARASKTIPGNPLDPTTTIGPLADLNQFEKVSDYVRYGVDGGARLSLGGKPFQPDGLNGKGYYYLPTIFTEATNQMRIAREEIFGPVLTVIPFSTEEEAIRLANDSDYGLASGIHTLSLKRAHRVARALQAGTVWVNTYNMFDASTPFGGYKASGFGRECGPEVMENYTQYKSVWIDLS